MPRPDAFEFDDPAPYQPRFHHRPPKRSAAPLIIAVVVALVLAVGGIGTVAYVFTRPTAKPREVAAGPATALESSQPKTDDKPKASEKGPASKREFIAGKDPRLAPPATWKKDAEAELAIARANRPTPEPLAKPALMTEAEYIAARGNANAMLADHAIDDPEKLSPGLWATVDFSRVRAVIPRAVAAMRREGLLQVARTQNAKEIDQMVNLVPPFRPLLDPDFRRALLARLPAAERKRRFDEFAALTGEKERWSLIHPFDELNGDDMAGVLEAVKRVKDSGLGAVSKEQRELILRAGAVDFFAHQLDRAK